MIFSHSILVSAIIGLSRADFHFRSRPDLSPPRLNITIAATSDVTPGYIFVGPYPGVENSEAGPEQPGAYILKNDGDLVWSSVGYLGGLAANFQAARYQGQPVVHAFQGTIDKYRGHGYGTAILLDRYYKPVRTVQSLHGLLDLHEFHIIDEKSALVEVYQPVPYNLSRLGGNAEQTWIVDGIFQEVDIQTGEVLFEGRALDFADPDSSITPLPSGHTLIGATARNAWDYFHLNSIDKDDEGNYLVSGRHTSTIYKISGRDGSVIWQLGGKKSGFEHIHNFRFGYQHDARFISRTQDSSVEVISLFDNSAGSNGAGDGDSRFVHAFSRAWIVQLNHSANTATPLQSFTPPDLLSAQSQGNAQLLKNGNVFVNWGQKGAVTEFSANGTAIFHAYLDSEGLATGVQSYRGFRYEWDGYSRETPAIVAVSQDDKSNISIYISWNGDTQTTTWRFYQQYYAQEHRVMNRAFETHLIGEVQKTTFESTLSFPSAALQRQGGDYEIFAEAIDKEGAVLGKSAAVKVEKDLIPELSSNLAQEFISQAPLLEL